MLYMIILTHGSVDYDAVHMEYGDMARDAIAHKDELFKNHGVTIQSACVDAPAHLLYLLVNAPNTQAAKNLMEELKFCLWKALDIHLIILTLEEAIKLEKGVLSIDSTIPEGFIYDPSNIFNNRDKQLETE